MPAPKARHIGFYEKTMPEPNSGCWLWTGCIDRCGYGKFSAGRETLAHRYSFTLHTGPIQAGLEIDHKCGVRCCVNPDHLRAITHTANVRRADYKKNHRNSRKTNCKRGHLLGGPNLLVEHWRGLVMRKCRTCRAITQRARKAARAA